MSKALVMWQYSSREAEVSSDLWIQFGDTTLMGSKIRLTTIRMMRKSPLFIGFLHHSRWLFGISSINRRSGVESGYTRYPETNIQVRP